MSILREGDKLELRLLRSIKGKPMMERVALEEDAVRYMSTPELLRTFVAAIATATERLDIAQEYAANGAEEEGLPWCNACQSYHAKPRDKAHHEALHCFSRRGRKGTNE